MLTVIAAVMLLAEEAPLPPPPPPPSVEAAPAPAVAASGAGLTGYELKSRAWLRVELQQLEAKKPPLAPQILVMIGGLGCAGAGTALALRPNESGSGIFAAFAVGGLISATVAAVLLAFGIRERAQVEERIAMAQEAMQREQQAAPPVNVPPPPPPPPATLAPVPADAPLASR